MPPLPDGAHPWRWWAASNVEHQVLQLWWWSPAQSGHSQDRPAPGPGPGIGWSKYSLESRVILWRSSYNCILMYPFPSVVITLSAEKKYSGKYFLFLYLVDMKVPHKHISQALRGTRHGYSYSFTWNPSLNFPWIHLFASPPVILKYLLESLQINKRKYWLA